MKKIIVVYLSRLLRLIYRVFTKLKLSTPSVIVMVDGGLCSQMHQYMIGYILKNKGVNVEYDLSFYKKGLDLEGNPTRIFLLEKVFPNEQCNVAPSQKVFFYKHFLCNTGKHPKENDTSWLTLSPPVYLGGYYTDTLDMYNSGGIFKTLFKLNDEILSPVMMNILNKIRSTKSIGVHIRRGDLKSYNVAYGYPVTLDYIRESIKLFKGRDPESIFYFFSDDRDYIVNEVIPTLDININYWLSESGFENVYEDFILLANCKALITSKGTMGKYAALYENADTIVVAKDDKQKNMLSCIKSQIIEF